MALENANDRILNVNLSWTREKSNSSYANKFSSVFIPFFAIKTRLQVLKFEFCQIQLR